MGPGRIAAMDERAKPLARLRRRIHFILEVDRFGDRTSRLVDKALIGLIVANVVAAVAQTEEGLYRSARWAFDGFEALSLVVFSAEYVLRVWSSPEAADHQGRLRFMLHPMMLLDLAVLVLPIWFDLRPLRILRLLRLGRYSPRLRLFGRVIHEKRDELFVGVFVAVVLLVACSTAMYHVEKDHNENFTSIPKTMWWGVATLTTVGYGDVYPITGAGKVLGAVVALLGIGVFALPAGILAGGFSDALEEERAAKRPSGAPDRQGEGSGGAADPAGDSPSGGTCPHCGASQTARR